MNTLDVHEAARHYAELGFKVLPANFDAKGRKLPLTPHGHLDASDDPVKVGQMFAGTGADIVGVVHDRFLVIDVDVKHNAPGMESLAKIRHVLPKPLAKVRTASGGYHFYFTIPHGLERRRRTKFLPGIDVLVGPKGWLCVPPSAGYEFLEGSMEDVAKAVA